MPETWPTLLRDVGAFDPPDDLRERVERRRSHEKSTAPPRRRRYRLLIGSIAVTAGVAAVIVLLERSPADLHQAPAPGFGCLAGGSHVDRKTRRLQGAAHHARDSAHLQPHGVGLHGDPPERPDPAGAIVPQYGLSISDRRLHSVRGHNGLRGGGILLLLALPSAAGRRRCAAAGIYGAQHYEGQTPGTTVPYRMFSPVTVDINPPAARVRHLHRPRAHARGLEPPTTRPERQSPRPTCDNCSPRLPAEQDASEVSPSPSSGY